MARALPWDAPHNLRRSRRSWRFSRRTERISSLAPSSWPTVATAYKSKRRHHLVRSLQYEGSTACRSNPQRRLGRHSGCSGSAPGARGDEAPDRAADDQLPDLRVRNEEILQESNKVIVRSELTGTQRGDFVGLPPKNRALNIMAIDIHEFRDDEILRTWHTTDWLTGLHQLGAFDK